MPNLINHIAFADDDQDDHDLFSMALSEISPAIILTHFYRCDALLEHLSDEIKPLPDLIFLDYNMHGNNGDACLKTIKATARTLHIPVVVYSTSEYSKYVEETYRQGAYKYVVKQSIYSEMKATLKNIIEELENDNQNLNSDI